MKKNLLKILMVTFIAVGLSGCYTVMWMPNQNSANYQDQQNQNDYYYPENYYGDYNNFYDSPWWYNVASQNSSSGSYVRDTSKGMEFIRNAGERGSSPRAGGLYIPPSTTRPEPILTPASSTTSSTPANNNTGKVESPPSSGSNANSSTSSRSSNNNRPARNDNGRKTNGRN